MSPRNRTPELQLYQPCEETSAAPLIAFWKAERILPFLRAKTSECLHGIKGGE